MVNKQSKFRSIDDILGKFDPLKDKYISREFQKYGYDLAQDLGDLKSRSLYIKLAKEEPRGVLEKIKYDVLDSKVGNKKKLFMWKVGQYRWRKKLEQGRLERSFFEFPPDQVGVQLLGKILVSIDEYNVLRAGEVVETEAYFGQEDLASHARFGQKGRARIMFGEIGVAYVYLIYGTHSMFNIVVHQKGQAGAVLVRSLKPLVGGKGKIACGSGKLTAWLKIDKDFNGEDLVASPRLWIARGREIDKNKIDSGPRIGVEYAEDWADKHYRFWIKYSRYVSK